MNVGWRVTEWGARQSRRESGLGRGAELAGRALGWCQGDGGFADGRGRRGVAVDWVEVLVGCLVAHAAPGTGRGGAGQRACATTSSSTCRAHLQVLEKQIVSPSVSGSVSLTDHVSICKWLGVVWAIHLNPLTDHVSICK